MTAQKKAARKAAPRKAATDRKPPLEQRVSQLEAQVADLTEKLNKVLVLEAAQLAQRMQPQMQQAILAKLTGGEPVT